MTHQNGPEPEADQRAEYTECHWAEEALAETLEQFYLLGEGVKDTAIFTIDADGDLVTWNPGIERLTGYEADEIISLHFSCLYTDEDVRCGKPDCDLAAAAAEGRLDEQSRRVRKDGSSFWAHVILTPLRDRCGKVRGFANVIQDLSARNRMEEALRRQASLLATHY